VHDDVVPKRQSDMSAYHYREPRSLRHSPLVNRGSHAHVDFPLVTGPHAPLLGHVLTIRRPAYRVVGLGTDLVTDTPVVRGLIVVR